VARRPWRETADLAGDAPWVAFDTRDDCREALATLAASGRRSLVLDRDDLVNEATWTVLPVLHAAPCRHPRVRGGGPFCIVPAAVRRTDPAPETERDLLLMSFGGADPLGLTERLAAPLAQAIGGWRGGPRPALHAVVGPSFAEPERACQRLLEAGFHVHRALPRADFAALLRRAAGALVGFGTTLQELAWLGVPFVSLTHHREDVVHARRLEGLGVGAAGGFGAAFDAQELSALLTRSLFDPDFRRSTAMRARELLGDGRGATRILSLLSEGS
jgi:spore coat polysaccharide biosynthesis predicted glycosyltransferase SpsG